VNADFRTLTNRQPIAVSATTSMIAMSFPMAQVTTCSPACRCHGVRPSPGKFDVSLVFVRQIHDHLIPEGDAVLHGSVAALCPDAHDSSMGVSRSFSPLWICSGHLGSGCATTPARAAEQTFRPRLAAAPSSTFFLRFLTELAEGELADSCRSRKSMSMRADSATVLKRHPRRRRSLYGPEIP
jgi:hypothetical protein